MTDHATNAGRRQDSSETQRDILAVARRLFTTIGYRKTTVADIAAELGMSPANVYRFFDSKKSINEAVAELLLGEIGDDLEKIAKSKVNPSSRLSRFVRALAQLSEEKFMTNKRVNDMVEDAMIESWSVCIRYIQRVHDLLSHIVEAGRVSGDFQVDDPVVGAACVKTTMVCFMHPTMMATRFETGRPDIEQVIQFILRGLGAETRK